MDCQEVIPEEALFVVTDEVGLQHLLPALRARRYPATGAPSSMLGAGWRAGMIVRPASSGDRPVAGEPVTRA